MQDGKDHDTDSEIDFVSNVLVSITSLAQSHPGVYVTSTGCNARVDFLAGAYTYTNTQCLSEDYNILYNWL